MYAAGGLVFPYLQGMDFFRESHHCHHLLPIQEDELLFRLQSSIVIDSSDCDSINQGQHLDPFSGAPPGNTLVRTSTVSDYDLGGEGDLFKAPEPIIEEPVLSLDPMTAAMSMISGGEDIIPGETIKVAEIDSIETDLLLSEVYYECKKDLLAKSAMEEALSKILDAKVPVSQMEEEEEKQGVAEGPLQKSVSSGCLTSRESYSGGTATRPEFLDFQGLDLGAAFRMRRAYSEGDIKTLESSKVANTVISPPPLEQLLTMDSFKSEEREQKLSRYRKKRTKRNFGRKIKYACRKALADSQPRVRGRFAKTEECQVSKHRRY